MSSGSSGMAYGSGDAASVGAADAASDGPALASGAVGPCSEPEREHPAANRSRVRINAIVRLRAAAMAGILTIDEVTAPPPVVDNGGARCIWPHQMWRDERHWLHLPTLDVGRCSQ